MRLKISCAVVLVGLFAAGTNAQFSIYAEAYEMVASPDTVAGTWNGNVLAVGDGGGTNGSSGFVFSNGIGTFLDDGNSSGNQGFYLPSSSSLLAGSRSYIVDMRLKVLQDTLPSNGTSFSFKSGGVGRGLHVDTDEVHFVSSGYTGMGSSHDFTAWGNYRVVVDGDANMVHFYELTNYTGGGGFWEGEAATLLASASMTGPTGAAGELGDIGFSLGSLRGNGTTLSNFQLDWVRVAIIPEPATLALLAFGATPLLRRRR